MWAYTSFGFKLVIISVLMVLFHNSYLFRLRFSPFLIVQGGLILNNSTGPLK